MKKAADIRKNAKTIATLLKALSGTAKALQLSIEVVNTPDAVVAKTWTKFKTDYDKIRGLIE